MNGLKGLLLTGPGGAARSLLLPPHLWAWPIYHYPTGNQWSEAFLPSPLPLPLPLLFLFLLSNILLSLQLLSYTKNPSALCELFHFHDLPGGREPSGWQLQDASQRKTNSLAGFWAGPVAHLGTPAWVLILPSWNLLTPCLEAEPGGSGYIACQTTQRTAGPLQSIALRTEKAGGTEKHPSVPRPPS
jgi:hypothetical protein